MTLRRTSTTPPSPHPRSGFTLVELMVSLALIIFIMSILSAAFGAASKTVRDLKSAGDLAERLRGVTTLLRYDLSQPHFTGNKKLSDANFWGAVGAEEPPRLGFFRIYQGAVIPLNQQYGLNIIENINTNSSLHFTVRLPHTTPSEVFSTEPPGVPKVPPPGTDPHPVFTAPGVNPGDREARFERVGGSLFKSEWAEVAYWLEESLGETTDPESSSPQKLYKLMRRQRLLWPYGGTAPVGPLSPELSTPTRVPPTGLPEPLNMPDVITAPLMRFGMNSGTTVAVPPKNPATDQNYAGVFALGTNYAGTAEDIVMADVLSFDVQVLLHTTAPAVPQFVHLSDATVQAYSHNNPYFGSAAGRFAFDTWSTASLNGYDYNAVSTPPELRRRWEVPGTYASIPLFRPNDAMGNANRGEPIRLRALKITLRIYDVKTGFTRQVSVIQDM